MFRQCICRSWKRRVLSRPLPRPSRTPTCGDDSWSLGGEGAPEQRMLMRSWPSWPSGGLMAPLTTACLIPAHGMNVSVPLGGGCGVPACLAQHQHFRAFV